MKADGGEIAHHAGLAGQPHHGAGRGAHSTLRCRGEALDPDDPADLKGRLNLSALAVQKHRGPAGSQRDRSELGVVPHLEAARDGDRVLIAGGTAHQLDVSGMGCGAEQDHPCQHQREGDFQGHRFSRSECWGTVAPRPQKGRRGRLWGRHADHKAAVRVVFLIT